MSNLLRFPSRRFEKEEAGQWLARIDRGLLREESDALHQWLGDPRCREALFSLARDWDGLSALEELAELFPLRKADDFSWRLLGRTAAALLIVALAATFALRGHLRSPPHAPSLTPAPIVARRQQNAPVKLKAPYCAKYSTVIGGRRTVELPDHSKVVLNTNTELKVEYSTTARLLEMTRGEAMFEVAKDPNRVFTVRVSGYDVKAVGTAFDIRAGAPGGLRLTVTEGRVRVHRSPPPQLEGNQAQPVPSPVFNDPTDVEVAANRAVSVGERSERIDTLTADQVAVATAWQRGEIVFKSTPLQEVVHELARYSATRFVMADPALARIPVSGYFQIGDMDSLVSALQQNLGIKITKYDRYFLLSNADK